MFISVPHLIDSKVFTSMHISRLCYVHMYTFYTGQVQGGWSPKCSCVPSNERCAEEEETTLRDAAVSNVPANQVSNKLCARI